MKRQSKPKNRKRAKRPLIADISPVIRKKLSQWSEHRDTAARFVQQQHFEAAAEQYRCAKEIATNVCLALTAEMG